MAGATCRLPVQALLLVTVSICACSRDRSREGRLDPQAAADTNTQRIIGGEVASQLPAVGAFRHCTGTLIGPRKVLTAGHCLYNQSLGSLRFMIGVNRGQPDMAFDAESVHIHPGYDNTTLENDIGYVILTRDVPVTPIPLVDSIDSSWKGRNLLFMGYGHNSGGTTPSGSGVKREVWIPLSYVGSADMNYGGADRNTCFGDSGGPALHRDDAGNFHVAGVTSYGTQKCRGYSGATRVDVYRSFIGPLDPPALPANNCGRETYEGRCEGDDLVWCEAGRVHRERCSDKGKVCSWSSEDRYYACQARPAPEPPADPCAGETFSGRCEGDALIWCGEDNQVQQENCAAWDKVCGWSEKDGYFDCLSPMTLDGGCGSETFAGRCEGNVLIWCERGQVVRDNCVALDMVCGWSSEDQYHDCIRP